MNKLLWPPPTNSLSVEEMVELRNAAEGCLSVIVDEIPKRCAADGGHRWDNPEGKKTSGEKWVFEKYEIDPERTYPLGSPDGHMVEKWCEFYRRKCNRCGFVEDRFPAERTIEINPFQA